VRVLIVDDSGLVRDRLRTLLAEVSDLEIEDAGSTRQARRALAANRVDVVILDLRIGPNSGLDLLVHVKARAPEAIVIVLTNESSESHRRECLCRGADHFFDKSRQFEQAVDLVRARAAGR
jgi:DNA-binding NarL/FixJ family response regulator